MIRIILFLAVFTFIISAKGQVKYPVFYEPNDNEQISNKIHNDYFPVIGVWVWGQNDLLPGGYKDAIDGLDSNSPFNLIVPFLRFHDKEVMDDEVYNQVKLAAEYANKKNIGLIPDIDVRSARRAFKKLYPDELQQMLRLKRVDLSEFYNVEASVASIKNLYDHYGGGDIPNYDALDSELLRVYAYRIGPNGIVSETLQDITHECEVVYHSNDSIRIQLPAFGRRDINQACIIASFTLFYPDVFAPNILNFQREILKKHSDIPLPGACKDEWGFPPYYPRYYSDMMYDFWYSPHQARAYAERTKGRGLVDDCLLMAFNIKGQEVERQVAVNHFTDMVYQRNVEIESDFYDAVKEYFGPDAIVTVHPTWWPYPDFNEMKKNGLSWWAGKRDWAQTDEVVPVGVRTALSKKWDSPVWYNMYYTSRLEDKVWGSVLAGGRIMYLRYYSLYKADLMRAENRLRMLNYISESPMDCQVAVIFGHSSAMNWAGSGFDDVGMQLVDTLWYSGYPTDLIPTSEIKNGSLQVDEDGWICYGKQKYSAVVLYHPEYEEKSMSGFFNLAANGRSTLLRIGNWTRDFEGMPVDGSQLLPVDMKHVANYKDAYRYIIKELNNKDIVPVTPATTVLDTSFYRLRGFAHTSYFPPNTGHSYLIDGTRIMIAATDDIAGDPIKTGFKLKNHYVSVDAVGVVAIRLDDDGTVDAFVASDLKYLKTTTLSVELENRLDVVFWKNNDGAYEGVIQANEKVEIPEELLKITDNWSFLLLPGPPTD